MKIYMKLSLSLFMMFTSMLFWNCEAEPEKYTYGIAESESKQVVAGFILNSVLQTTTSTTVRDPGTRLEWKKCSQGQSVSVRGNCQGTVAGTNFTPNDQGRYGALALTYCNVASNACNSLSLPQTLVANTLDKIVSGAYTSCQADRTGGYSDWRVPNFVELKLLASTEKTSLLIQFPDTVDDFYWSSTGNEQDNTGATARAISFHSGDRYGKEENAVKDTQLFVRCVRNY
jgi:CubicO group peptidase (beta-lactamase class C family)